MKIIFNNTLKDTVKISHISCTQIGPKKFYCKGTYGLETGSLSSSHDLHHLYTFRKILVRVFSVTFVASSVK